MSDIIGSFERYLKTSRDHKKAKDLNIKSIVTILKPASITAF